ncbi:MAG TPA: LysR family transcriptional regulator [Burkholderiaceae bacterium]|nr:LysR family transcriptional regulator [Burkholderiaceae bacterium]
MRQGRQADLNRVALFAAVAEAGGFTAAAERAGVTKAKLSLEVRRLESALGVNLLTRTTRRVTLTEAGRQLYETSGPLVRGLRDALAHAGDERGGVTGSLRISAPVDHAEQLLAAAVAEFAQLHPQLQIDLSATDRVVDLVAEGFDLAVRVGWLRDSTMRAARLGEFEQWVVASPAYLRRHPAPKRVADLAAHEWLALTLLPTPLTWKFTSRSGRVQTLRVKSRLRTDSATALRALLVSGAGVSVMNVLGIADDVRNGRLERLLPGWSLPRGGVFAVYPPGRHPPASVRAFVEFYRKRLQEPKGRA